MYLYGDLCHSGLSCNPGRFVLEGSAQVPGKVFCIPGLLDLRRYLGAGFVWHCRYPIKEIDVYILVGRCEKFRSILACMRNSGAFAGPDWDNLPVSLLGRGAVLPESGFTGLNFGAEGGGAAE